MEFTFENNSSRTCFQYKLYFRINLIDFQLLFSTYYEYELFWVLFTTLCFFLYLHTYKSVDPAFWLIRFHLMASSIFVWKMMIYWLKKKNFDLESLLIFVLFFKKKKVNKIRKKTLSATPYSGKGGLWKTGSGSGVKLLIGKVRYEP